MKILINTNYNSAGTKVCVTDLIPKLLQAGHNVKQNDFNHSEYDIVLFMGNDSDVLKAKSKNKNAIVRIFITNCIFNRKELLV